MLASAVQYWERRQNERARRIVEANTKNLGTCEVSVSIDGFGAEIKFTFNGEFVCWSMGELHYYDARQIAKEFIDGKRPIRIGENTYIPRHRVRAYHIGPMKDNYQVYKEEK